MGAKRNGRVRQVDAPVSAAPTHNKRYLYAGLDDAPLILDFEQQLAQQRERDPALRQIAAFIDFGLACVMRGVDPRVLGRS
jgi:hypothetical protein